ncbi:MAG: thioesterase family protein, partial [Elusimicrobiota bacterium]
EAPFAGMGHPAQLGAPQPGFAPQAGSVPGAPAPGGPAFAPPHAGRAFAGAAPGPPAGKHHQFEVRVTYADTDRLGIIYYANYLKYFELGRTELLRMLGIRYRDLETDRKIFLPAVESRCEYIAPCRYDDLVRVQTWISWMGPASLCFQNEVRNREDSDRLVARGFTRHAVVDEYWKPTRVPKDLRDRLLPYVAPHA